MKWRELVVKVSSKNAQVCTLSWIWGWDGVSPAQPHGLRRGGAHPPEEHQRVVSGGSGLDAGSSINGLTLSLTSSSFLLLYCLRPCISNPLLWSREQPFDKGRRFLHYLRAPRCPGQRDSSTVLLGCGFQGLC